jgi:hypothetical protein
VASALPTLVELAPTAVEQQPAQALAAAAMPDQWSDGTLPGVMAGKRPAL